MKKYFLSATIITLSFLLCSCQSSPKPVVEDSETSSSKQVSIETADETEKSDVKIVRASESSKASTDVTMINIGDTIITDHFEFTLEGVNFSYEIKPTDTSSVYSSYSSENGQVYIDVKGSYKNTSERDHCIRDLFTPIAVYDTKYTYQGFAVVDTGNNFDWVSSYVVATPLQTCKYHGLIDCPEEVKTGSGSVAVIMTIDNETYQYNLTK